MSFKLQFQTMVRSSFRRFGYDICRAEERRNPFLDMGRLAQPNPIVFDVGANVGQTIAEFRNNIIEPQIHAFEPSRQSFGELKNKHSETPNLYLNDFALGANPGMLEFIENTSPDMSSFLEPSVASWGEIKQRVQVHVETIDDYCTSRGIKAIDILKSDTQGYDLEVIKGAKQLLAQHRIQLIYLEVIFSEMYKGLPRFDQIFGFLADRGFVLVTFYRSHYQNGRVSWTDALFVNPQFDSIRTG